MQVQTGEMLFPEILIYIGSSAFAGTHIVLSRNAVQKSAWEYGKKEEGTNMTSISDEVHLRHLTVDEALLKLDKYLNDALMAGLHQIRVVHGKGTGTLRQETHRTLAKHPLVKSYRLGGYGEGGAGVTIVELT